MIPEPSGNVPVSVKNIVIVSSTVMFCCTIITAVSSYVGSCTCLPLKCTFRQIKYCDLQKHTVHVKWRPFFYTFPGTFVSRQKAPAVHPDPLWWQLLWFSESSPLNYQESINQIVLQLLSVIQELLVMTSDKSFRALCIQTAQLVEVKWDLSAQTIYFVKQQCFVSGPDDCIQILWAVRKHYTVSAYSCVCLFRVGGLVCVCRVHTSLFVCHTDTGPDHLNQNRGSFPGSWPHRSEYRSHLQVNPTQTQVRSFHLMKHPLNIT